MHWFLAFNDTKALFVVLISTSSNPICWHQERRSQRWGLYLCLILKHESAISRTSTLLQYKSSMNFCILERIEFVAIFIVSPT
jgi:hypothetical protein